VGTGQASGLNPCFSKKTAKFQASVDLEGLRKLQAMLEKYQGILEMMQPDAQDIFK
jgi:hypothetical protein